MELGKNQVKLMRLGFVLGGFVLLWETQKESKKTPGHSIWLGHLQRKNMVLQKMCCTFYQASSGPVLG